MILDSRNALHVLDSEYKFALQTFLTPKDVNSTVIAKLYRK